MTLDQDIALLGRIPLFHELAGEHLRLLAFSAVKLELAAGRVLFRADTKALSGFVVVTGEIELSVNEGEKRRPAGIVGPGSLLGETALFVETRRPATATALTDCTIIEIDRKLMRRMLTEYPEVAARLHAGLVARLSETVTDLDSLGSRLGN